LKLLRVPGKYKFRGSFLRRRILIVLALSALAIIMGTIGYVVIEDWPLADAFYMTIITMTTVGFGEVRPLNEPGRWFTIFLILGGIGIMTYATSSVVQLLLSGELRAEFIARRRRRMLAQLQNHYIVCGFGRVGRHVAAELHRQKKPFVVVDSDEATVEHCRHMGYNSLFGNAANDEILEQAGIYRARSLITAVSSDAENVFIVLTARSLRPDLVIVSRANFDESEPKLLRAGANHVIIPYAISGRRMVASADHPTVVDFLDVVMHSPELELWLEDIVIDPDSSLVGRSLREANLRSEIGVNVLSMQLPGQPPVVQPDIDIPMQAGTHLIVLGTREQLETLAQLAGLVPVKT
jgi:voltage-gated potassium channel